jgi:threonine dehydrogenase-like Zn-dependent dehydrogenase
MELIGARGVRVADMVTHRLPLAEAGLGFHLTANGQDSIKVIIDPLL